MIFHFTVLDIVLDKVDLARKLPEGPNLMGVASRLSVIG